MRKIQCIASLCVFILTVFITNMESYGALTFHVSKSGNNSWTGKLDKPNNTGTDGPFRTLERAREAVRTIKRSGALPDGGITVTIHGGVYQITETFSLTREDFGTENSPIIWRAAPGEEVRFTGGKSIGNFGPVTNPAILKRIDKAYRGSIVQSDLKAQGITDYGEIKGGWTKGHLGLELFFKGKPTLIARYPNKSEKYEEGWMKIAGVPQSGEKLFNEGIDRLRDSDGIRGGRHYGRFTYNGDRPKRWAETDDIWMQGYYMWDWADAYQKVERIDSENRIIYPAEPHHNYGYMKGMRFYFLNILEELDSPGEYYLNRSTGILYFRPQSPIEKGDAVVTLLRDTMLNLENTSHITIQGIIFECSRATAVEITGGTNNKIAGCVFRNLQEYAVKITDGTKNGIVSCDFYDVDGGIILHGGNRKTLTPAGNYAANNDISHYSRVNRTYRAAIDLNGVGQHVYNNHIHDSPHVGVFFWGNDHILEYNDIHDIAYETGDVGAFYIGRDWTMRGNIIRYNYVHHLEGPGHWGVMGVYLDDWASGTHIHGNIFYKTHRAVLIGAGRNNIIENNIAVNCTPSFHIDARGLDWAKNYFEGSTTTLTDRLDEMDYRNPPYSERHPILLTLYNDEPAVPKYNKIERNISYGGRWLDLYDAMDFSVLTVKRNLIADPVLCEWHEKDNSVFTTYSFGDRKIMDDLINNENIVINGDPGFYDIEKEDFRLREDSPAWNLGFKRIPVEKIGLYKDKYRND